MHAIIENFLATERATRMIKQIEAAEAKAKELQEAAANGSTETMATTGMATPSEGPSTASEQPQGEPFQPNRKMRRAMQKKRKSYGAGLMAYFDSRNQRIRDEKRERQAARLATA